MTLSNLTSERTGKNQEKSDLNLNTTTLEVSIVLLIKYYCHIVTVLPNSNLVTSINKELDGNHKAL